MAGAALRGFGKALLKKAKPSYPKAKPRGTPTRAGLTARRGALRGETTAEKYKGIKQPATFLAGRRIMGGLPTKAPPSIKKTAKEVGKGAIIAGVAYAAGKAKGKKEAKAKETKEKLKKSTEEHKKKTKEKREKHGKPHA